MKVFLTVGSMLPFDRLVRAMDAWAGQHPEAEVKAQVGDGAWTPAAFAARAMYAPPEYRSLCEWADVIVSHVGMGTVITAADLGRPLVALPRRASLGEVTSDHQSATARWLARRPGITIVEDETGLAAAIEAATHTSALPLPTHPAQVGRDRLVAALRQFLLDAGAGINTTRS